MKSSLFDMSGIVAVVTGSTKGIDRAIAEALADAGALVVISSRKQISCERGGQTLLRTYAVTQ